MTLKFLSRANPQDVRAAAYYATRLIKHRKTTSDIREPFVMPALSEPSPAQQALGLQILEALLKSDYQHLSDLSDERAGDCIKALLGIVNESITRTG